MFYWSFLAIEYADEYKGYMGNRHCNPNVFGASIEAGIVLSQWDKYKDEEDNC